MTDTTALYKLIILYMLDKVDFPLATAQISEFILDKGYTSYFKLQEVLSEMQSDGLLKPENTYNRTLYHLTENGADTIHYFHSRIPEEIRKDIHTFLKEKEYDLKEEVSARADYFLNTRQEYEVVCQIIEENSCLLELKLTVPTKQEAEAITGNWTKRNQELYTLLMSKLL